MLPEQEDDDGFQSDGPFQNYADYSKTLRAWLVAYGIGGPVLFRGQKGSGSFSKRQAVSPLRGLRFTPAPSAAISNTVNTISATASQRSPAELHASDTPWQK